MMKNQLVLFLFLLFAGSHSLFAQCGPDQTSVRLEIDPDQYENEVSWTITDGTGNLIYATGQCTSEALAVFEYCVPSTGCSIFSIKDSYGDGILPDGYYRLYVNNTLLYENPTGAFGMGENVSFNCPPGSICDSAFPLALGTTATPEAQETWYAFTPADTGAYTFSTCNLDNICPTKIWVYDRCQGIVVTPNQTGALFYADGGCDDGASATLYLAGGKEYFFRVAYAFACDPQPIHFNLQYDGPIKGCTDPTSCNYNPLATVADSCFYGNDPHCTNFPDLMVLESEMRTSMMLDYLPVGDQCTVDEGCLRGVNNRYIIRFSTHIKNIGTADYFIGGPPTDPATPSDQFVYDACHGHWHYRGYAEYILFDAQGNQVPIGSKNGFCVLDLECEDGGNGKYSCGNMGVSHGCGDVYNSGLPCQWIDVTDLPAGTYTFVMRVNWDKSPDVLGRYETSYDNNWAQACFSLAYQGIVPNVEFLNDCPQYTDCLGELFGSARADCEGNCNGAALLGDWNKDTLRNDADVQAYLAAAMSGNVVPTTCQDLHADGQVDLFDAALLQECELHGADAGYWHSRFPCQFPTGVDNVKDVVYLLPGQLDTVAHTFDVQLVNPYNKLLGYEFKVSGLTINSVENLLPNFGATATFNANGKIMALAANEVSIKKNILPVNAVRIHYGALTSPEVCVAEIYNVINDKYQRSNALLADPNCVNTGLVNGNELAQGGFSVFATPNPFQESLSLFFPNPNNEPVTVTLSDMTGRVLRAFKDVRTESVVFERGNLPAGVYAFSVKNEKGRVSGKVVAK